MNTLIHPTAVIHPQAEIGPNVTIGPYSVIEAEVTIGANNQIGPHVVISGPTNIGSGNRIFPGAVIGLEPQDLKYRGAKSRVKIGNNNIIREYVTINRATAEGEVTVIGDQNLLMAYVHVAHNCAIANKVVIANNVALAGHVSIESKAVIGGVLGVHQFVHIGTLAMVGGMSRIDRDVPPYMLVEGNPGRVRSLNFVGLKRTGMTPDEIKLLKEAFRLLYNSQYTLNQALEQLSTLSDLTAISHLTTFLRQSTTVSGRRGPIPGK